LRGDGSWALVPSAPAAGSSGQIQFNSSNAFAASSNLFWDNTNSTLGIGTTAPGAVLDVAGAIKIAGTGTETCNATNYVGGIRYNAGNIQFCNGSTWSTLGVSGASLTTALVSGDLFVGNGSGVATAVAPSGDITMTNAGVFTVAKVDGVTYPSGGTTVNTVPVITGANTITYETVPNAALTNSSVTLGSTSVSLGGTASSVVGLSSIGIGTATASKALSLYSATSPAISLVDGTQGVGKVLTSDASGNASWATVSASASSFTGTLAVANGGTGQSTALTQGGIVYGSSTTAMGTSAASTAANQVLVGETTGAPSFVTTTLTNTAMTFAGNGTVSTAGT
jgi:hypothetical protein